MPDSWQLHAERKMTELYLQPDATNAGVSAQRIDSCSNSSPKGSESPETPFYPGVRIELSTRPDHMSTLCCKLGQ